MVVRLPSPFSVFASALGSDTVCVSVCLCDRLFACFFLIFQCICTFVYLCLSACLLVSASSSCLRPSRSSSLLPLPQSNPLPTPTPPPLPPPSRRQRTAFKRWMSYVYVSLCFVFVGEKAGGVAGGGGPAIRRALNGSNSPPPPHLPAHPHPVTRTFIDILKCRSYVRCGGGRGRGMKERR